MNNHFHHHHHAMHFNQMHHHAMQHAQNQAMNQAMRALQEANLGHPDQPQAPVPVLPTHQQNAAANIGLLLRAAIKRLFHGR